MAANQDWRCLPLSRDVTGMKKSKRNRLSRCACCRRWFHPSRSALKTQKTCSAVCRRLRRKKLAKQRRERDLHEYRVAERQRQRDCRRRRQEQGEDEKQLVERAMSRAGLAQEHQDIMEDIFEIVDKASTMSRASLRQELLKILLKISNKD